VNAGNAILTVASGVEGSRDCQLCRFATEYLDSARHDGLVMTSLQVFYEGNVQGVGFRWTVRHAATGFDVTGWIRNLSDGRVELQVNGEENEVRAFLDRIAQGELHSLIPSKRRTNWRNRLQPAALKFAMTDSPRRGRAEADPAVAVHSLTKIFPVPLHPARGIVAVKDLNLRIEPGEVLGCSDRMVPAKAQLSK